MANTNYKTLQGNGSVATADYKTVKFTGKTKGGVDVEIELSNAINLGDIDLTFAEKDDTVAQLVFTACYSGTETTNVEPWSIKYASSNVTAGEDEIVLGAGVVTIGSNTVALCRGGGSFKVVREFRRINADGDRGPVKGRIVCDASEATLTVNALTWLTTVESMYTGVTVTTTTTTTA